MTKARAGGIVVRASSSPFEVELDVAANCTHGRTTSVGKTYRIETISVKQ
jgi:hypothetical protein